MHKRTKALAISPEVKLAVYERDNGECVWCGRRGLPEAHFIPRSLSGIGVEKNILTLCRSCHRRFDESPMRGEMKEYFREYLSRHYEDWDEADLIYRKE